MDTEDLNRRAPARKLTIDDVRAIRSSEKTDQRLAAEFDVTTRTIWNIRRDRTWAGIR